MKFSVFTASTPTWTPEEAVQNLAKQGWDGIEWGLIDSPPADTPGFWEGNLSHLPLTGIEENVDRFRELTASAGLEISAIGGYSDASPENLDKIERLLAVTAALGARQVRVNSPMLTTGESYPALMTETRKHYAWIAERAAEHGVKALVETHHRLLTASGSAALRLLDGLDPRHVGVIHDLGNTVIEGQEDYLGVFQMLGDYLAHIHVKNAVWEPLEGLDPEGATVFGHHWTPLRNGQASVFAYFAALRLVGYNGWVTVEDFSQELPLEERTLDNLTYLKAVEQRVSTVPSDELRVDERTSRMNRILKQ
ncbi:sugar phosphate isomerase/epimerase family protein [Kribbella sp. CA-245084]|uniref:sugar phosphate isomerase/epimerase family protein n=1 Tax=Kribbella sp. CA-245084 TaxID=3239940 RepID=UPI003D900AAA